MTGPEILSPFEAGYLAGWSKRNDGLSHEQAMRLVRSHERLRDMFAEACVRVGKQSELLGRKAEKEQPE